jgi:hypothetical protein
MRREAEEVAEREKQRFKLSMIVAHPEMADRINEIFDSEGELAEVLSDEEMEEMGPLSGEQIEDALEAMRSLGIADIDI